MTQINRRLKALEQRAEASAGGIEIESLSGIELKRELARLLAGFPTKYKYKPSQEEQARIAELQRMTREELEAVLDEKMNLSPSIIEDEEFQAAYFELTGERYTE